VTGSRTRELLVNPYYAMTISEDLTGEHPPMVTEDEWVAANRKLIDEVGADEWLRRLLRVLKGDYPRNPSKSVAVLLADEKVLWLLGFTS
jgi:hypothetical protein